MEHTDIIRVAVLNCASFLAIPSIAEVHGSHHSDVFTKLLLDAQKRLGSRKTIECSGWDVLQDQYPPLDSTDALIVSGSKNSVYDNEPWIRTLEKFIQRAYHEYPRVRIFGACFGHQIVAHALLGEYGIVVEKDLKGHELGVQSVDLNPNFAAHFQERLVPQHPHSMSIQFIHGDQVRPTSISSLPPDWMLIGSTEHCAVQGFFEPFRVLTFQGHFEFNDFINTKLIEYFFGPDLGYSKEYTDRALASASHSDDASNAAEILFDFVSSDARREDVALQADVHV
jgi:GMP synthase-like glutamine amidotransferase